MNITDKEKKQLRNKISVSVSKYIQRRRYLNYAFALAATCILGFFVITEFQDADYKVSPIEAYIKTLDDQKIPNQIQLVLGDDQNVSISEDVPPREIVLFSPAETPILAVEPSALLMAVDREPLTTTRVPAPPSVAPAHTPALSSVPSRIRSFHGLPSGHP